MTLLEAVTGWRYDQNKHDRVPDHILGYVNNMTQYEFLEALSEALEGLMLSRTGPSNGK